MADVPKEVDRCGVKHEIAALILTGIRGSREKRLSEASKGMIPVAMAGCRRAERIRWPPPAIILYGYQKKGVAEIAFRKLLILKGAVLVDLG